MRGVGQAVILPNSFVGGPRWMRELYHDGMALVRKFGKADLFLTMTAPAFRRAEITIKILQLNAMQPTTVDFGCCRENYVSNHGAA